MGLPVALTSHENDDLVTQDNTEVCEMLAYSARKCSLLLFSQLLGVQKSPYPAACMKSPLDYLRRIHYGKLFQLFVLP